MFPLAHKSEQVAATLKPWFKGGVSVGNLSTVYTEYSGLTHPTLNGNQGYLWAINDGATNYFIALNKNTAATAGQWTATGVTTSDVEDCASCSGSGVSYLWLADIGDNGNARSTVQLVRCKEPLVTGAGTIAAANREIITCEYPPGDVPSHKDCETILADPDTGDIYFITKRISPVKMYRLPWQGSYVGTQTLESVGSLASGDSLFNVISTTQSANNGYAVGGNISPNGSEIAIRNYSGIFVWRRNKSSETIAQCLGRKYDAILDYAYVGGGGNSSLTTPPKFLHPYSEPQGESVSWDFAGINLYTCSEELPSEGTTANAYPLFKYERLNKNPIIATYQFGVSGYSGCMNTFLDQGAPTTNNSQSTSLVCDFDYSTFPAITRVRNALIKFDLTGIPSGAQVVSSYIELYVSAEGKQFQFNKMLTGWGSGSTYNSMAGGVNIGTDCAATPDFLYGVLTASQGIDSYLGMLKIPLPVSTIQEWVANPLTNSGWAGFGGTGETSGDGLQISSITTGTITRRPRLTVAYIL